MPKRSVYLKDEEDALYERVKELAEGAGETIASVFVEAMRGYVARKEEEQGEFSEITVFIGEKHNYLGNVGENVKFIGRLIACDFREEGASQKYEQALYRTRKQKFLLLHEKIDQDDVLTRYEIFDSVRELKDTVLLPKITQGLKDEQVGVRYLDI